MVHGRQVTPQVKLLPAAAVAAAAGVEAAAAAAAVKQAEAEVY